MITLRQLNTLRVVAGAGSLSAAARELDLSQSAVSLQMHELEREAGVPLFRLRGRRQTLAPAGAALADYADRILALTREAADAARAAHVEGGLVRVAASSTPGGTFLPAIIAAHRRRHPAVTVRFRVADTAAVEELVRRGEADVGVVGGVLSSSDLAIEDWVEDEIVLVVSASHSLARRRRVEARDLAGETLLARERGSATRMTVEAAFLAAGAPLPPAEVVGESRAIERAVEAGLGVAFLSRFAVADAVRAGRLRAIPVRDVPLRRPLRLLTRRGSAPTPAVSEFLALLRERSAKFGTRRSDRRPRS